MRQPMQVLTWIILRPPSQPYIDSHRYTLTSMTKSLYAEFTALPGKEQRVSEILQILAAHVRREEGNVVFQPFTRATDPRRFFVFEEYVNDAAFDAHISAEYGARFNAELATLIEGTSSDLTWLASIDS
ncbi:hypothetical protein GCM10007382_22280 [Salinibacterium xinjiangense]|nr:hypothetical protein GCM10007382_22280 [Salinibacterium xinjiangense]